MVGQPVSADWALISKDLDAGIGAGILAHSGRPGLAEHVARYAPGSPSSTEPPESPGAPPWITFGEVADEGLVSAMVTDSSRSRDHAHRQIWPQRFFLFSFAHLAAAGASFWTVWRAVQNTTLQRAGDEPRRMAVRDHAVSAGYPSWEPSPGEDEGAPSATAHAPLALTVEAQSLTELTAEIDRDFERIARVAVAVLEGRVAIEAPYFDRNQRVQLMDAVAALLPYGFRAGLSASSSVDNTTNHRIRLVFASGLGLAADQHPVSLASPPAPRTAVGHEYLELLREKARHPGLLAMIEHLWGDQDPRSFARPKDALASLRGLDQDGATKRKLAEGTLTREEFLGFLGDREPDRVKQWLSSPSGLREQALHLVLGRLDDQAAAAVLRHWGAMSDIFGRWVEEQLLHAGTSPVAWSLTAVSRGLPGGEDGFLGRLIQDQEKVPAPDEERRRMALVGLLRNRATPERDTFTSTCGVFQFGSHDGWQARLVRELLAQEIPDVRRAIAWAEWLCLSKTKAKLDGPGWLDALRYVLGWYGGQGQEPGGLQPLLDDDVWVVMLLWLAAARHRLGPALRLVEPRLLALAVRISRPATLAAPPGGAGPHTLQQALDIDLWQLKAPAKVVALVDVVRMVLGGPPVNHPREAAEQVLDDYGDVITDLLLSDQVRPWRQALLREFLSYVVPGGRPSSGAVWFLNNWSGNASPLKADLVEYIEGLHPEAFPFSEQLGQDFWAAIAGQPRLARFASSRMLMSATRKAVLDPQALQRTTGEDGLPSTELALAYYTAHRAGLQVREIAGAMRQVFLAEDMQRQMITPSELDHVLREIQTLMFYRPVSSVYASVDAGERAERELEEFRLLIARDYWFGARYGKAYRSYLRKRLRDDIRTRRRMIGRLSVWRSLWRSLRGFLRRFGRRSKAARFNPAPPAAARPAVPAGQQLPASAVARETQGTYAGDATDGGGSPQREHWETSQQLARRGDVTVEIPGAGAAHDSEQAPGKRLGGLWRRKPTAASQLPEGGVGWADRRSARKKGDHAAGS